MKITENDLEFLDFIPLFGERACGIAVIRLEKRFVLRFKIIPSDQSGFWVNMSALKTGKVQERDKYEDVFQFDSDYERQECHRYILKHVNLHMMRQAPSVEQAVKPPVFFGGDDKQPFQQEMLLYR